MKTKSKDTERIEKRIREIAKDYEGRGYTVTINPKQSDLPPFIRGYEPDILASNDLENVIVEVKTSENVNELHRFQKLADSISKRKKWRFELVLTNPKEQPLKGAKNSMLNDNKILLRIQEINQLKLSNHFVASFLLGWATLEALVRDMLSKETLDSSKRPTLSIIKTLFSLGLVNREDYQSLEKLYQIRTLVVHGFNHSVTPVNIESLLIIIGNLIEEKKKI